MMREKMVADMIGALYDGDPEGRSRTAKGFAGLGPFGEFAWKYLIERVEPSEPGGTAGEPGALQREFTEMMIDKYHEINRRVESCTAQGLPLGSVLEKVREGMSPSTGQEKKVIEICLKWIALKATVLRLAEQMPLERIASDFQVSDKCVREVYFDFVEILLSDYMGNDHYRTLDHEHQERLKGLFLKVVIRELTVQEFVLQARAERRRIDREIAGCTLSDLLDLSGVRAKSAMRLFMGSGGKITEQELVEWAEEKQVGRDELESLLSMRSRTA